MRNNRIQLFIPGKSENRINPLLCRNDVDTWLMGCLYQGIMMFNENIELVPRLLSDYYNNCDCTQHILELKPDLLWSDNKSVSSEDIKFTIEIILSGFGNFQNHYFKNIKELIIIDSLTLRIVLKKPDKFFKHRLLLPILPKHIFENIDLASFYSNKYNKNYIGCGPYKLIKIEGDKYFFDRNDAFHLGAPKIRNMIIQTGSIEELEQLILEEKLDFTTLPIRLLSKKDIYINSNYNIYPLTKPEIIYIAVNHRTDFFRSIENRNYIYRFIDKKKIINNVYHGFAENLNQFYPKLLERFKNEHNHSESRYTFNDYPLSLKLGYFINNEEHELIAKELVRDFKVKGIDIILKKFDSNIWKEDFRENKLDMFIITQTLMLHPDPSFAFGEKGIMKEIIGWEDEENLSLIKKGLEVDPIYFKQWSKYIGEQLPVLFICSPYDVQIINKRIRNIKPDPRGVLWNIHEIEMIEE
ncbi:MULTISPECIES: ABC transporter substrate-binding protein [unclassified Lysinibacillus]|uniref:ABC transporter substrate-binding protein n=1 Tax=unclassified Lysinibacillus TaxID=2636778 RepID=UPI00382CFF0D